MKILKKVLATALCSLGLIATTTAQTKMAKDTNGTDKTINDTGTVGISGWEAYNELSAGMTSLDGADFIVTKNTIKHIGNAVNTLGTTRPDWMNTEEINEDIEDVQKEYGELITGTQNWNEKEYKENLEELAEKYEDLREEADETYMEYVKINRQAYEEANEEKASKAIRVQNDDAREEYGEEVKELVEVRDGKSNKRKMKREKKKLKRQRARNQYNDADNDSKIDNR